MNGPILRTTDVTGEVYDDPSEDALYMFMEDLESSGSSFLVERVEPGREGEWMRITYRAGGLYELDSSTQDLRYVGSLRSVHEYLTRWAFDLSSPKADR